MNATKESKERNVNRIKSLNKSNTVKTRIKEQLSAAAATAADKQSKATIERYLLVKVVTRQHLDIVASRKMQNAMIDFMRFNNCTVIETVTELTRYNLCKSIDASVDRYARHNFNDYSHVIAERSKATRDLLNQFEITDTIRFNK